MRKLGLIFAIFLCLSLFFAPTTGFAQPANGTVCDYTNAGDADGTYQQGKCVSNGTHGSQNAAGESCSTFGNDVMDGELRNDGVCISSAENSTTNAAQTAKQGAYSDPSNDGCSLDSWSVLGCLNFGFTWLIKTFLLNIAGILVWVSANMLNYAVQVGILDFSKWAPDELYPIWIVIRQIVSLFVVFAGLWLGLMYIIGKDEKFEKYIPWVVIFALFVNFSYPIARTAVDISNVISLNIYASAVGNDALTGTGNNTAGALIMTRLGLDGLALSATKEDAGAKQGMVTSINTTGGALLAVVFILYAAYIFFMVTALLVMRTAALVFLIIASPILFIDSVIPRLGDEAVKLRKIFFEQLAVGPVFMIMLALTLKFLGVFSVAAKAGGAGVNPTIVEFFNITMMLVMLHIMLKVTKATAGSIGEMATNAMGKVGGFATGAALGVATGGAGFLARGTMGRAAGALRDSKWMQSKQGGLVGRHMYNMTDSVAKSSFDARNSSYVRTGASKLGLSGGMGAGEKLGYEEIAEQRAKNLTSHLGRVGTHQKTTYKKGADGNYITDNGNLVVDKRKGTKDDSEEAQAIRREYMNNAGGALFATKQQKLDTRAKMEKADGNANKKILTDEDKERQEQEVREAILNGAKISQTTTPPTSATLPPLPSGSTTTPSGIIVPVNMNRPPAAPVAPAHNPTPAPLNPGAAAVVSPVGGSTSAPSSNATVAAISSPGF
ncbi:hypothetical protein K9M47_03755 [Candidatus Gracilibacteria bacterium]|nr:hypothetical protein [Candidatus Gracilibacteria bacterium]MCF7898516.1 hypothetical protein [Candidatus Paceibacterota bacterium]